MEKQMLFNKLKDIVGSDYVLHSNMDLTLYGYDASLEKGKPDVVVLPNSTEEVSKVVRLAHEEKIPIIGRGSGTNLSGGTIPVKGGIVVHFSRMNRVLEVDIPNRTVTVEPGVYLPGEFDVAGTIVGVLERDDILPRKDLKAGDILIGLKSSAFLASASDAASS